MTNQFHSRLERDKQNQKNKLENTPVKVANSYTYNNEEESEASLFSAKGFLD
jgi:hypothetical protein